MTKFIAPTTNHTPVFCSALSRRQLLAACAVACCVGPLTACRSPLRQFLIGLNDFVAYRFFDVAQHAGYFSADEVRTMVMPSATHVAQSLASGVIDAALLTLDEVLRLRMRQYELDIVLVVDISNGIDVVLARPPIGHAKDIKGKKIAVEIGAVGSVMLNNLLREAHLSSTDVEIVYANLSQHKSLYESGEVDVVISFAPTSLAIAELGANLIFSSKGTSPQIIDVMVVNRNHSNQFAEVIKKVVAGFLKTVEVYESSPDNALEQLARLSQLSVENTQDILTGLAMQNSRDNRRWLQPPAIHLQQVIDELSVVLQLPASDIAPFVTNRYLP